MEHDRHADKPGGARLMGSMFALHSGSFFGLSGKVLMMLASLLMPLFAVTGWLLYLDRRARKRRWREGKAALAPSGASRHGF